jgi:hypothetical protein
MANKQGTAKPIQPSHTAHAVEGDDADKRVWTRVGEAWPHGDGQGFSITLTAMPFNGRIVLRARKPEAGE